MKRISTLVVLIGLTAFVAAVPAMAQLKANFKATATFYAGNAKLPAGTYTINQMTAENGNVLEISNAAGTHSVLVECRPSSKSSKAAVEVVFNRYGNTDYMESILTNSGTSVDLIPSPSVAEKIAAKTGSPQTHSVPATAK